MLEMASLRDATAQAECAHMAYISQMPLTSAQSKAIREQAEACVHMANRVPSGETITPARGLRVWCIELLKRPP